MKLNKSLIATYSDGIILAGLTQNEVVNVKNALTFDNPAYVSAKKYSRYQYVAEPPYVTYYKEINGDTLEVPLGFDLNDPSVFNRLVGKTKDIRVCPLIEIPKFAIKLREDQKIAAGEYIKANVGVTKLSGSVQMPTGKGKSILGIYLASYLSTKTLIVVHKDALVKVWQDDIRLAFDNQVIPGLIKAQKRVVGDFITIATIQTLSRMSPDALEFLYSNFGFVIQDEMHHCPASTFSLVSNFKARFKLGLTATPERRDGLTHVMQLYFGDFCFRQVSTPDDEDILPVKVIVREALSHFNPTCSRYMVNGKLKYRLDDLTAKESVSLKSDHQAFLKDIPYSLRPSISFHTVDDIAVRENMSLLYSDVIAEYNKGHSCVVFFSQKEHCRIFGAYFNQQNNMSTWFGYYFGDNSADQNLLTLTTAQEQRQFITITTYAKSTEGTNVQQWEVAFLASSLNDGKNVEQAVGRIRRVMSDGEKLNPVIVYDYRFSNVYSMYSHGLTRDRRYIKLHFMTEKNKLIRKKVFTRGRSFN